VQAFFKNNFKYDVSRRTYCSSNYENNSNFDVNAATHFIIKPLADTEVIVKPAQTASNQIQQTHRHLNSQLLPKLKIGESKRFPKFSKFVWLEACPLFLCSQVLWRKFRSPV
jgi:hypothetical protein